MSKLLIVNPLERIHLTELNDIIKIFKSINNNVISLKKTNIIRKMAKNTVKQQQDRILTANKTISMFRSKLTNVHKSKYSNILRKAVSKTKQELNNVASEYEYISKELPINNKNRILSTYLNKDNRCISNYKKPVKKIYNWNKKIYKMSSNYFNLIYN